MKRHKFFAEIVALLCASLLAITANTLAFAEEPPLELNTALMEATVRLDGMTVEGPKVATGFIMGRPIPNNPKRAQYVLVTANHVLNDIRAHLLVLTARKRSPSGVWEKVTINLPIRVLVSNFQVKDPSRTPISKGAVLALIHGATRQDLKLASDSLLSIRDAVQSSNLGLQAEIHQSNEGYELRVSDLNPNSIMPTQLLRVATTGVESLLVEKQLWTKHPTADVAAMYIRLIDGVLSTVLPTTLLAEDAVLEEYGLHPGDELNFLGYPLGAEGNAFGFPILRSGKIASYPLLPTKETGSFLMDFQIFGGNSGGPVYLVQAGGTRLIKGTTRLGINFQAIVGIVSQEVSMTEQQRTLYEKKRTAISAEAGKSYTCQLYSGGN